jgi:hypothetical protein
MESTQIAGDNGDYPGSETHSDQASRLLRDAEHRVQATQDKLKKQGSQRQRTRGGGPLTSGGTVILERQHRVDKRYRDDILEDIQSAEPPADEEKQGLLHRYLKKIIR